MLSLLNWYPIFFRWFRLWKKNFKSSYFATGDGSLFVFITFDTGGNSQNTAAQIRHAAKWMLYLYWQPYNCNHNFEFPLVLIGSLRKSYIAYRKSVLFICSCLILKQIPSAWCKFVEPYYVCMQPFIQKSLSLFYLWTQSQSKKKRSQKS